VKGYKHDWKTLITNKNKEIDRLNGIYGGMLSRAGVDLIEATGSLKDDHTVTLTSATGEEKEVTAETILIAVGGWPFKPDIPGIEHTITSNEIFYLEERPERMVIVGGGYIAVEFASVMHGYGTKVTQLYRGEQILRGFDDDIRNHLADQMVKNGIDLKLKTDPVAIEKQADGSFIVKCNTGEEIACDQVFYGTGRKPKTANIGLEKAGVETTKNGTIPVDTYGKTNVPNIYAVGDVTDRIQLTPVALYEGHSFADTMYGGMDRPTTHEWVASAVFSNPEIGTVGYTEAQAVEKYGDINVYTSTFRPLLHTISGNTVDRAYFKIVVDNATDRVVGVHMCGAHGAEILQGIGIAVKMGATKKDFDSTIGIHPSSAEEFVTMREQKYHYVNGKKVMGARM